MTLLTACLALQRVFHSEHHSAGLLRVSQHVSLGQCRVSVCVSVCVSHVISRGVLHSVKHALL